MPNENLEVKVTLDAAGAQDALTRAGLAVVATYDSTADTIEHVWQVRRRIYGFISLMTGRAQVHDASKLGPNEKPYFDAATPRLRSLVYGSDEYRASLKSLGPALQHHYANNSHHPEHWPEGIAGMSLLDLVEMYCDWLAATLRSKDGDFRKGLEVNVDRFKIDPQLAAIFRNTFERHGDLTGDVS